ncbi:MAG: polysaccharide biosynthesis/export family protein [Hyphomicrobiaceae bacterium]
MRRLRAILVSFASVACLTGCAAHLHRVENPPGPPYMPEKIQTGSISNGPLFSHTSWAGSIASCSSFPNMEHAKSTGPVLSEHRFPLSMRLSRGDRVNINMLDGEEINGDYVIGPDGQIGLPYVERITAVGLTETGLASRIDKALLERGLAAPRVSVRVVKYAAIQVSVAGAVFQPGFVTINDADHPEKNQQTNIRVYGDVTIHRNLSAAIREASGARPDADLSAVKITRRGRTYAFNMRGAITGRPLLDPALEDGDQIFIPSSGCFDNALVRPSIVTPRGIRIYVSKIHIGPDARYDEKIPFGLRLLQGAVIASCVGGNLATEGHRQIILVSTNPVTGNTEVVQRPVEQLVRDQARDDINPMLMPDDAIACYDSTVREAVGVANALTGIATSISSVITAQKLLSGSAN